MYRDSLAQRQPRPLNKETIRGGQEDINSVQKGSCTAHLIRISYPVHNLIFILYEIMD